MQSTSTPNYYLNSSLKKEKNKLNRIKTKSLLIQMFQLCLLIPERRKILQQHLQLSGRRDVHGKPTIRHTSGGFTFLPINSASLISHFCVWCFTSGRSRLLRNTSQRFTVLILEHYMTLNYVPWRNPPWRTGNHFTNTFLCSQVITKEAWTWPLGRESSRARTWSHHSFLFLEGKMPLLTRDTTSPSPWHLPIGGESSGWIKVVNGERERWGEGGSVS